MIHEFVASDANMSKLKHSGTGSSNCGVKHKLHFRIRHPALPLECI